MTTLEVSQSNFEDFLELSKKGEGMVFMGAGGNPEEWINGVAGILKEENISSTGQPNEIWRSFHLTKTTGGRRDLLMLFTKKPDVLMSRLAIWRLRYGDCSWLSDYVVNYASQHAHFIEPTTKPVCKLVGTDGNVFALAGKVSSTLRKAGQPEKAKEFMNELQECGSYDEALALMMEYVEVE